MERYIDLYYIPFQSLLWPVRQQCVDFMLKHQTDYEPFICVSGMPFDHYCFEMRKSQTWGGQVEVPIQQFPIQNSNRRSYKILIINFLIGIYLFI